MGSLEGEQQGIPASRVQRRNISGECHQIFLIQIGNNSDHEQTPDPSALSMLEIIKLPDDATRRAAGNAWNWAETSEIGAMTDATSLGLPAAPGGDESLTLFKTAHRARKQ
jgi:hypothetical protein